MFDPILWIFTGYTTLRGRRNPFKNVVQNLRRKIQGEKFTLQEVKIENENEEETKFEDSAQIVRVLGRAAFCDTLGKHIFKVATFTFNT